MIRALALAALMAAPALADDIRATGDLGVVVERASGALTLIDQSDRAAIGRVEGLGDLSHASVVFSPDERFAYVFGRDGGLTKVDIVTGTIAGRVMQAGNAIGGAISDDGTLVAVSNYEPGGVRVFDAQYAGAGRGHSDRIEDHRSGRRAGAAVRVLALGRGRDVDRGLSRAARSPGSPGSRASARIPMTR